MDLLMVFQVKLYLNPILDFPIYIDAAHEYLPVYLDLVHYWDYLKDGGRYLGDDYTENWPGVKQAVNQFAQERNLQLDVLNDWVWKIDKGFQTDTAV
jgi:hypothetical protein